MNKKIYLIIVLLFLISSATVFADKITKVGVFDRIRILQTFYKESQTTRAIEDFQKEIQKEIVRLNDEIKMLKERKLNAENRGDEREALSLDKLIFDKIDFLKEYVRIKSDQLNEKKSNLSQDATFANELHDVIKFIGESQGFSVVLDTNTPGLVWWNGEVDITDMILQEIQARNHKNN